MIWTFLNKLLALTLSMLLIVPAAGWEAAAQEVAVASGEAPLSADVLQQLVAPIALYPDALVAQILGATTFPDQISDADLWLQRNKGLTGNPLMQAIDNQTWDPSVKALSQFPSVMDNLAKNLAWTSSLGEAYHNQPTDVMLAVQALRLKAKAAGNLKSGSQIVVVQQSPQVIVIQPANPQVVYVPTYNPAVVYGAPVPTPGYSTAAVVTTALLSFGVGIAVGAAINNSCCGWGYNNWNCNWHGGTVVYHSTVYHGNAAWHGGYYGSGATAYGPHGTARVGESYNPVTGTHARGGSVSTPYGTRSAGQAYNPNTGAYAATHQVANAHGTAGSSVVSKNGETAYTQHATSGRGSAGAVETSSGGRAASATGAYGNHAAAAQAPNGNKYATANGNTYKDTGDGWQKTHGSEPRGYGEQHTNKSGALGGGSGWDSRQASARGNASRRR